MEKLVVSKVVSITKMLTTNFELILGRFKDALGFKHDSELAEYLGLDPQAINSAKKRGPIPTNWFIKLASKTDISINWLLHGTGPVHTSMESSDQVHESCLDQEEYRLVPLLESRVTAGPDGEILYDDVADRIPFKRSWLTKLVGRSDERQEALLLVRVRGDSMSPTIDQGEIALVDTNESERISIKDDRIYLIVTHEGTVAIKRLVIKQDMDGRPMLVCLSDNKIGYRSFTITIETGKSVKQYVLGRLRWAGKEFE